MNAGAFTGDDELTGPGSRGLTAALPDFVLSFGFLAAWIAPGRVSAPMVRWLLLTMILEFIVIHSAAFMGNVLYQDGDAKKRGASVLGLTVFYSVFVAGFALAFHSWWPLWSFWVLVANRAMPVLMRRTPDGETRALVQAGWAGTTLCYLLGCALTTLLPLPRLGFTPEIIASLHLPSSGLWISQPWRPMAFGTIYFAAVGLLELNGFRVFVPAAQRAVTA